jgi:DNA-3-methyladenine glycosylase I
MPCVQYGSGPGRLGCRAGGYAGDMAKNAAKLGRCPWAKNDRAIEYHDTEWGVPCRDDRTLFEFLILEGAQAGLSWDTILAKRERYREVYDGFDWTKVARYSPAKVAKLLADPGIVRNRLKVAASIDNAKATIRVVDEFGSLNAYLWSFVQGEPIVNRWTKFKHVPAKTAISDAMSKDLKKRGFRFVGSTICYAFMQATGMVNDHLTTCPRHSAVSSPHFR